MVLKPGCLLKPRELIKNTDSWGLRRGPESCRRPPRGWWGPWVRVTLICRRLPGIVRQVTVSSACNPPAQTATSGRLHLGPPEGASQVHPAPGEALCPLSGQGSSSLLSHSSLLAHSSLLSQGPRAGGSQQPRESNSARVNARARGGGGRVPPRTSGCGHAGWPGQGRADGGQGSGQLSSPPSALSKVLLSPGCSPLCQMSPHHGAPLANLSCQT